MTRAAQYGDLRTLVDSAAPFVTVAMPTPSGLDDARHRFEIQWKNARRDLESSHRSSWSAEALAELDAVVSGVPHDGGESVVLIRSADGTTFVEALGETIAEPIVADGALPRLAVVIAARQRVVSHLLVEIDRAGADIHAFDGGDVVVSEQVEGDTEHIHRGHPGGWSQRRFQQRAENTWERNAGDVADQISELAAAHESEMIFVSGDSRAQHLVLDALADRERDRTTLIEAGSVDGVADEVGRLLADHVARRVTDLVGELKERLGTGTAATEGDDIMAALEQGRVEHLLVNDDGTDEVVTTEEVGDAPAGTRVVDAAIAAALRSDASITVVPRVAILDGPIAALYRW